MNDAVRSTNMLARNPQTSHAVDNADWLKTAAIILVAVDHIGYFFMEDDTWWSVFGRLAAPTFFFLMGYAQTRTIPSYWIWLGVILTLLDSSNNNWSWVAPNILLSFALIRLARPHVQLLVQHYHWAGLAFVVCVLFVVLPIAGKIVDYGAEGWLWALFGLCQRMYVDESAIDVHGATQTPAPFAHAVTESANLMRLLTCFLAMVVYVWQEQKEYSFPQIPFTIFLVGVGVLSLSLCLFHRAASPIQPPKATASVLRFIGRHTLEIYAIQLAGSELIVKLVPHLTP